jgi:Arc/MetJ family transcription regulator
MAKTHTTLDLDRELLRDAAEALGTTRTTDTVHAALRDVVARRRRAWLARRDFSALEQALPELRTPRTSTGDSDRDPERR